MARDDLQLKFRVPALLKAKLEAYAEANKRSLNAEIIARLESTLDSQEALAEARRKHLLFEREETVRQMRDIEERLRSIEERIKQDD